MKRELAAIVILLVLLGVSLVNLAYYDGLTDRIKAELLESKVDFDKGDTSSALEAYGRAETRWLEARGFTHIFIRHAEIDSTADAFFELKQQLLEENQKGCIAAYDKLLYHLDSIDGMEHPRLGSVF